MAEVLDPRIEEGEAPSENRDNGSHVKYWIRPEWFQNVFDAGSRDSSYRHTIFFVRRDVGHIGL